VRRCAPTSSSATLKLVRRLGYCFGPRTIVRWRDRLHLGATARRGDRREHRQRGHHRALVAAGVAGVPRRRGAVVPAGVVLPRSTRVAPADPDAMVSPPTASSPHRRGRAPDSGHRRRGSASISRCGTSTSAVPRSDGSVASLLPRRVPQRPPQGLRTAQEQLWLDYEEPNGRLVRVKQISAPRTRLVCFVSSARTSALASGSADQVRLAHRRARPDRRADRLDREGRDVVAAAPRARTVRGT